MPFRQLARDPFALATYPLMLVKELVKQGLPVVKIGVLLERQRVVVPYRTLHRFCVKRCGFGSKAATVRVADGEPGAAGGQMTAAARGEAPTAADAPTLELIQDIKYPPAHVVVPCGPLPELQKWKFSAAGDVLKELSDTLRRPAGPAGDGVRGTAPVRGQCLPRAPHPAGPPAR